ncbi:MAG: response regulator [Anaerolineae bacterium]
MVKTVLIVDDSATMRRMIMASLRGIPALRFDEASTGLEAIERLALNPADVMILDLNMPDMHGLETLQFLRGHRRYKDLPVIVLTTRGDEVSRSEAMAAGASLYMTKPFQPHELAENVRRFLASEPTTRDDHQ